jgi:hypothetical protein
MATAKSAWIRRRGTSMADHRSIDKDVVQVIIRDGMPFTDDGHGGQHRSTVAELVAQITDLQIANGLLQNQVKDLRGDLNIERLHRDAKLCSECPRAPEFERLRAALQHLDEAANDFSRGLIRQTELLQLIHTKAEPSAT